MSFEVNLSKQGALNDPVAELFKASVLIMEQNSKLKGACVGKRVDIGSGKTGTVTSVDTHSVHAKDSDGKAHSVTLTSKRAGQLLGDASSRKSPRKKV